MIKTRNGKFINTNVSQNKVLKLMYGTLPGRIVLKGLTAPIVSETVGKFMDSSLSKCLIKPFIKANNIDTSQYIMDDINTYNQFFTREIKPDARKFDLNPEHLISPCDSKLSAYKINSRSVFRIKNSYYRVADLLKNKKLAEEYMGGMCLIFRLEVDDYHRYCYIDNGSKGRNFFIKGVLHTVNPVALEHYNIYKRNSREYTVLKTNNFGDVVQVEVGAMMVGRICNHHQSQRFMRGEEKGMFEFGGSTIVLLFKKNSIILDEDILENSKDGHETVVKMGEKIGEKFR